MYDVVLFQYDIFRKFPIHNLLKYKNLSPYLYAREKGSFLFISFSKKQVPVCHLPYISQKTRGQRGFLPNHILDFRTGLKRFLLF